MSDIEIINKTEQFVKEKLEGEGSGHDWWHIYRVWKLSTQICDKENGNLFVVELAALLHDIADWKFHDGNEEKGSEVASEWLCSLNVESNITEKVADIIRNISYKGAGVKNKISCKEGMIVQDADRLDAIGAIGIARTFAYGGFKNREMYNPDVKPQLHNSFEEYKKNEGHTINHFYEKLLLLKDRMNTETAKDIANERHLYMESFLNQFYKEWVARI